MRGFARRTLFYLLLGAGVGFVASMWWGPSFIAWWYMPPGSENSMVAMCGQQIMGATRSLVQMQLLVAGGLGLVFAILANVFAARRRKAGAHTGGASSSQGPGGGPSPDEGHPV